MRGVSVVRVSGLLIVAGAIAGTSYSHTRIWGEGGQSHQCKVGMGSLTLGYMFIYHTHHTHSSLPQSVCAGHGHWKWLTTDTCLDQLRGW
jgi:hypothetical protein